MDSSLADRLGLAVNKRQWETVIECFKRLSFSDGENLFWTIVGDPSALLAECRRRGYYDLATKFGLYCCDFNSVKLNIDYCQETVIIDLALEKAALLSEWDFVWRHLPRCSQNTRLFCKLLYHALYDGEKELCKVLLAGCNPIEDETYGYKLLHMAVKTKNVFDREELVKLCIRAGLSTHVRPCTCGSTAGCLCFLLNSETPMKLALSARQLSLVKLLHKAGACTNKELFRFNNDRFLKNYLQDHHDILQYLDQAARRPRTLQDLCRLKVSSEIKCCSGRFERVASLDVTRPARALINFCDVVPP